MTVLLTYLGMHNMKEYDVIEDVLTKHKNKLLDLVNRNLHSEYLSLNIMDDIRLNQISEIDECLRVWKEYNGRCSTRPAEE